MEGGKEAVVKKEQFNRLVARGNERRVQILQERGKSYDSEDKDMLLSFKRTAEIANILEVAGCVSFKGSDIADILIILKQVRGKHAKAHGLGVLDVDRTDIHDDLHNYFDLRRANEVDEEEKQK